MNSRNSERLMCLKSGINRSRTPPNLLKEEPLTHGAQSSGSPFRESEGSVRNLSALLRNDISLRNVISLSRNFALVIVALIASVPATAQTLSLQNVLDSIEQNNPLIASFSYKISAANTLASGAKAWMPPMVGVGFDQTPYGLTDGETFFKRNEGAVVIMVQQDIPNPAKLRAKQDYLQSLAGIDSADIGATKNKLFTDAKTAYINRFIAEKRLKIINDEIALLNLMIETDTSVYSVNQSDLSYIFKVRARGHTMEAMRAHEKSAINEATAMLNYLMNKPLSTSFSIDTVIPFHNYNLADFDTSSAYVSLHRSDIVKIDKSINSMRLNTSLSLSAAKPDFNVRFEHFEMFGGPNNFTLVGSVSIPIVPWASRSYKSEALSMQLQIDAMNYEKRNNINEARSMIQQSLLHTVAEYEEVNHYGKEAIPAYRKAFQVSLLSYQENTNGLLPSLMAWDDLIMAQTEYLYHLEQAYKSEIAYENAIEKR